MNEGKKFDIVTSVEVIEHVHDISFFVQQLTNLTKVLNAIYFFKENRKMVWSLYPLLTKLGWHMLL